MYSRTATQLLETAMRALMSCRVTRLASMVCLLVPFGCSSIVVSGSAWFGLSGGLLAAPPDAAPGTGEARAKTADVSTDRIGRWIVELSATEYRVRREAFLGLWRAGDAALPDVRLAMNNRDSQTASAAKILETLLRLQIGPEDNDGLTDWLQISKGGLQQSLRSLAQKGQWRLMAELLKIYPAAAESFRQEMNTSLLCAIVQAAYDEGDAQKAWPVLEQLLEPRYRFWLAQKTGLPLSESEENFNKEERALLHLYRGEFDKAWELAETPTTKQRVIFLSGRWEWLADPKVQSMLMPPMNNTRESIAQHAAYAYLANDVAKSDQLRKQVLEKIGVEPAKEGTDKPKRPDLSPLRRRALEGVDQSTQDLINALLVCGDGDSVERLLPQGTQLDQFAHHLGRQDYDWILNAYKLKADLSDFSTWLNARVPARGNLPTSSRTSFKHYCDLSSFLFTLGYPEEGMQLYRRLMDHAQNSQLAMRDQLWSELTMPIRQPQLRLHLLAMLDDMGDDVAPEIRERLIGKLYEDWAPVASVLWRTAPIELAKRQPRPSFPSRLVKVAPVPATEVSQADEASERQVAQPEKSEPNKTEPAKSEPAKSEPAKSETDNLADIKPRRWALMESLWRYDRELIRGDEDARAVENWLAAAFREGAKMEENTSRFGRTLSEIAIRLGLQRQARTLAFSASGDQHLATVARMAMETKQLENAEKLWTKAIAANPREHAWIQSHFKVLKMLGEDAKADRLTQSLWLRPLDVYSRESDPTYFNLANQYNELGEYELADEYGDAVFSLYDSETLELVQTAPEYCDTLLEIERFQKMADVQRSANVLLYVSQLNRMFPFPITTLQYYLSQEMLARAMADLDAGKADSGLDRIKRYESIRPAGIEICEHAYGRLVKLGRQADATEMADRFSNRMLEHLKKYPRDGGSHNNLAWMYARCNIRLDEALEHATAAVELSDHTPTYVDTLAEVHFRLGHIDQAIALTRECISLDPRHAHYRKQLARFQAARQSPLTGITTR